MFVKILRCFFGGKYERNSSAISAIVSFEFWIGAKISLCDDTFATSSSDDRTFGKVGSIADAGSCDSIGTSFDEVG